MATHHHIPTEDLPSGIALFLGAGGILGMLLAMLFWMGSTGSGALAPSKAGSHAKAVGHVPQLVIGAEFGAKDSAAGANEDMSGLLQWLDSHPDYSVVVVPRR